MRKWLKKFTFAELMIATVFAMHLTLPPQDMLDWFIKFFTLYLTLYWLMLALKKLIEKGVIQMSVVDKLLKLDSAKLTELPTKTMEIKRLSEKIGEPFLVKCRAINGQRYNDIQKNAVRISKKGEFQDLDTGKTKTLTVLEGIVEPDLKREDLQKHFKANTPKELLYGMFLAGEVEDIYNLVMDLSGFESSAEEETVEDEIKN